MCLQKVQSSSITGFRELDLASRMSGADLFDQVEILAAWVQQLDFKNWPNFEISNTDARITRMQELASHLPQKELLRIDISPYHGGLAQAITTYSTASQYGTYRWPANLNLSLTGYMANVLYTQSPPEIEYGTPGALNEASKWCGCEFVFLNPKYDAIDTYIEAGWEKVFDDAKNVEIWKHPETPSLASVSSRPTILHVGYTYAFENIFKAAGRGAIPYDEAWLVSGNELVDHYSASELLQFDMVLLYGYNYKNEDKAWDLLREYVEGGGSLFIDTGWQWQVPDWQMENAPSVLPISQTTWTNYGVTKDYRIEYPDIGMGLSAELLAPLEWNGQPWSVSGVGRENVREWGRVVLSVSDQPLIVAGELGAGRVVWSGMNLPSHAIDKNNSEEFQLLNSLTLWLLDQGDVSDYSVDVEREHADRIQFRLEDLPEEQTWLLWREFTYPAWNAYLTTPDGNRSELPIYQAGPGFMLLPLPAISGESTVVLEFKSPLVERLADVGSILAVCLLVGYVADGYLFNGRYAYDLWQWLRFRIRRRKKKPEGYIAWLDSPDWQDSSSSDQIDAARADEFASEGAIEAANSETFDR